MSIIFEAILEFIHKWKVLEMAALGLGMILPFVLPLLLDRHRTFRHIEDQVFDFLDNQSRPLEKEEKEQAEETLKTILLWRDLFVTSSIGPFAIALAAAERIVPGAQVIIPSACIVVILCLILLVSIFFAFYKIRPKDIQPIVGGNRSRYLNKPFITYYCIFVVLPYGIALLLTIYTAIAGATN